MAHPSREKYFDYLKRKLGNPKFSVDKGWGLWENCKRSWQLYNPKLEYHLVVQDDAIICDDFIKKAEEVIIKAKGKAISFYYGYRGNLIREAAKGMRDGFLIGPVRWGIAICLPTVLIKSMIQECSRMTIKQDDTRIKQYLKNHKIRTYFPIPSLIDHRAENSLVGDPGKGRKAFYFIGNGN